MDKRKKKYNFSNFNSILHNDIDKFDDTNFDNTNFDNTNFDNTNFDKGYTINNNYKDLFDNNFNNYYYDVCNYPLNILNYVCSSCIN